MYSIEPTPEISNIAKSLKSMKDVLNGPIKPDNSKEVPSPEGEESLALPDSSSPKKKAEMVLQQYQANEDSMDAHYVSYILIDSKNHQNSHLPHQLWKLNPFERD